MNQPIIVTDGLTRHFGDAVAVNQLSFDVQAGQIFGFLGHNGAGKTTTVRLLNGVLAANGGTARVLGLDPQSDGPAVRRRTGVLTETPSLDERLTGRENLRIYADLYGVPKAEADRRVDDLLATFELVDRAQDKVGTYSRGMKQRLALARALVHQPELIFLDEPTTGLDPVAAKHVHDLVTRLARQQGRTVVLATHNLVEAQRLCDRVGVMEHGRLIAMGTPHELARRYVRSLAVEFEVAPENTSEAATILQAALGTDRAVVQDGIILVSNTRRDALPDLVAALVYAGVRIFQVTPQESTLEEVYFALHGEQDAEPIPELLSHEEGQL